MVGLLSRWLLALILISTAIPAMAETYRTYYCTFAGRSLGKEPMRMIFATGKSGKTHTYDTDEGGNPLRIPVNVRAAGNGDLIYLFSIRVPNSEVGQAFVTIQARIPKAGGESRVSARARRFRDMPSAPGNCALKENEELPY